MIVRVQDSTFSFLSLDCQKQPTTRDIKMCVPLIPFKLLEASGDGKQVYQNQNRLRIQNQCHGRTRLPFVMAYMAVEHVPFHQSAAPVGA